jgi:poly-gamma-glutamate capsule biosynthesis protein CapA/YwtB (metallophosphatase superfamily)
MASQYNVNLDEPVTEDDLQLAATAVHQNEDTVDAAFNFLLNAVSYDDRTIQIVKVVQAQVEEMKMAHIENCNTRVTFYKQLVNKIEENSYLRTEECEKLQVEVTNLELSVADLERQLRLSTAPTTQHVQRT